MKDMVAKRMGKAGRTERLSWWSWRSTDWNGNEEDCLQAKRRASNSRMQMKAKETAGKTERLAWYRTASRLGS